MLVLIGMLFCAGSLWFTAARSTIPLALNLAVVKKEIRHEKHPGLDDVHLLRTSDGEVLVVDGTVFEEISPGETITKDRWERQLRVGDRLMTLDWSADVRGMIVAMPLTACVLIFVAVFPVRRANGNTNE